jgi:hypothetical protein
VKVKFLRSDGSGGQPPLLIVSSAWQPESRSDAAARPPARPPEASASPRAGGRLRRAASAVD